MKKKYQCSKHGSEGDPNCKECWDNLRKLAEDYDAHIVVDKEDIKCKNG